MGEPEITASRSVTHLATEGHIAANTQNQARSALLFLYRHVLHVELSEQMDWTRAKQPYHLPVVLTREEARAVLDHLTGQHKVMAQLLYGSGLRLMECVRLRVKDLDFSRHELIVREGKGEKDRLTMLPTQVVAPLQAQLALTGFGETGYPHRFQIDARVHASDHRLTKSAFQALVISGVCADCGRLASQAASEGRGMFSQAPCALTRWRQIRRPGRQARAAQCTRQCVE